MLHPRSLLVAARRRTASRVALAALLAVATLFAATRAEAFIQGIDISHFQPNVNINWTTVKNSGVQFVFTKATEGVDFTDVEFVNHMNSAIAAGIPIGPYHFGRPNSGENISTDAVDEAHDFVESIKSYYTAPSPAIILRPVLDLERIPDDPVTPSIKAYESKWVRDFNGYVQAHLGVTPIVYVNGNYAQNYLETNINQYPLWFAKPIDTTQTPAYQNDFNNAVPPTAANMGIWGSVGYKFWQWSFNGNVGGISPVDRDVYIGTLLQMLQQFSPTYSNGDYNQNGVVDDADYVLWRNSMGQTVKLGTDADGDLSGVIDAGDFNLWKSNFGKAVPHAKYVAGAGASLDTAAVPEPSTLLLALFAACGLATCRRRS